MAKSDRNVLALYLKKPNDFKVLTIELIKLWYDTYGVYQSKGDIIMTALYYTRDSLKSKEKIQDSESILISMYARVGK